MKNNIGEVAQKRTEIPLLEYGRNIQTMVEYCLTIDNREERQACAETIISVMGNIYPEKMKTEEGINILWNHLAIMSSFELDVDYPIDIIEKNVTGFIPKEIEYNEKDILYPHYGHNIQTCISEVMKLPEGKEKDEFALRIAKQMKLLYITWNKESVDDYRIFKDLFNLSSGEILLNPNTHSLSNTNEGKAKQSKGKSKKK